jgi:hypothetical protein
MADLVIALNQLQQSKSAQYLTQNSRS